MPLRYRDRLISYISSDDYRAAPIPRVAKDLGIDDVEDFGAAVRELADRGVIDLDESGRIQLPFRTDRGELVGQFRGTMKGVGFVIPSDMTHGSDIFIPPDATGGALTGDTVKVAYRRDQGRERRMGTLERQYAGEVVEIVRRKRANFTGEILKQDGRWMVYPDGRELTAPVVVRDAESKNVREGDKVVLEMLEYPEDGRLGVGVIVKVLGAAGEPDVETQAVIAAYSLPSTEFPEDCVEQAREATRRFEEEMDAFEQGGIKALELRSDLTGEFICTIDPPDAKDYDDAISIKKLDDGGYELGIHIADVAHFIPVGSALDREAAERGNSVYLPRLVIPMLPEVLSNGICSLQEGVKRYAKSCFIRYDSRGNVRSRGFCQSVIDSRKRMTYIEAQALIDGKPDEARKHAKTETEYTDELVATCRLMDELARKIRERRRKAGMIHLDLPVVELIFDENGKVVDAEPEDNAFTHTIIEMFMVEANEALATLFEELRVPVLRRIHPEPTPNDTEDLRRAATVAGFKIPKNPEREELQALLDATAGTGAARAVHMAVLRTLTKASYSPAQIGHYALASHAYSHFTSPIRRYPDLTVHRALQAYLERTDNGENRPKSDDAKVRLGKELKEDDRCPSEQDLMQVGSQCSNTEVNATEAERELRQFLVLQLMAEHVGEEFDGVVTGVTPKGVYVQLNKYLADGMIQKSDLPGDTTRSNKPPSWRVDDRTGALVDIHSGRSYNMGDSVRVTVGAVDLATRRMDLFIADSGSRAGGKAKGLNLAKEGDFGGLGGAKGAGFKTPGDTRRSRKSKSRDKGKGDFRHDRKNKGKRQ
ncbi:MAG: VacB/RNase II family 3'-5' exoribonuclease [Phycisphaerales bacterium]|nr:VacB/RNase II family 3'-5' exoribonuclease [Planctomycetota bacterium]MCH8509649.1 VacB/RNase II family 3'-5' exoribonuclease [Phycisphaerales bacterium]